MERKLNCPDLLEIYFQHRRNRFCLSETLDTITFDKSTDEYAVLVGKTIGGESLMVSHLAGIVVIIIGTEVTVVQGEELSSMVEAL